MADKLIYIPNYDTQIIPFCKLQLVVDTQLNKPANQNLVKVSKVFRPTNEKSLL